MINGDTINIFEFWKTHSHDRNFYESQSCIIVNDTTWKGGNFMLEFDKKIHKIVFKEIFNPWTGKDSIAKTIQSNVIDTTLIYFDPLGFNGKILWFMPIAINWEPMEPNNPLMLGFVDLTRNNISLYDINKYRPKSGLDDIYFLTFAFYKNLPIFYFDTWKGEGGDDVARDFPFWDAPTNKTKVMTFRNGEFQEIKTYN